MRECGVVAESNNMNFGCEVVKFLVLWLKTASRALDYTTPVSLKTYY